MFATQEDESTTSAGAVFLRTAVSALILFAIGGLFNNWSGNERGLWWAWQYKTTLWAGLADVWYIFAWAFLVTACISVWLVGKGEPREEEPKILFAGGMWVSAKAGVLEELIFRWLIVLGVPTVIGLANIITFGLVKWVHIHWLLPLANWATLGILEPQLHAQNWVMGAAILYAAAAFRNEHAYLGLLGYINSWFIGMVMFYLVFNHGIITAIIAHFMYDLIIFSVIAFAAIFRPESD